jgi:sortase (surface protein transpeptidase)
MSLGDEFIIVGSDGHWYHYQVMDIGIATPSYSLIQALANPYSPVTAQLVACSKINGTATSTAYRIVVTGRLTSVT